MNDEIVGGVLVIAETKSEARQIIKEIVNGTSEQNENEGK